MCTRFVFAFAALSLLIGCAIHPLPEDVARVTSFDIVRQIRCDTRDTLREIVIGWLEKLAKQGGESEMDLIRLKLDLAASEKDFSVAQRTVQQVTLDLRRMETEHARLRGEQQSEIKNLKTRIAALKTDLENAQDNMLKSSDGFFSYIYPSVDSLDELTVTTSAGTADASGGCGTARLRPRCGLAVL